MEDDIIQVAGQQYVRVGSVRAVERMRVLKHDDTFGVFDSLGDISTVGLGAQVPPRHASSFPPRAPNWQGSADAAQLDGE
jgi:hypothetical protein